MEVICGMNTDPFLHPQSWVELWASQWVAPMDLG